MIGILPIDGPNVQWDEFLWIKQVTIFMSMCEDEIRGNYEKLRGKRFFF